MTAVSPVSGSSAFPLPMAAAPTTPVQWAPLSSSGFSRESRLAPLSDLRAIKLVRVPPSETLVLENEKQYHYSVRNQLDQQIYSVIDVQQVDAMQRPLDLQVLDYSGQVCLKIVCPAIGICCEYKIPVQVFSGDGQLLGDLVFHWGLCKTEFEFRDQMQKLLYKGKQNPDDISNFVVSNGNDLFGSIGGELVIPGKLQGVFSSEVNFSAGADPTDRALLLAGGIAFILVRCFITCEARHDAERLKILRSHRPDHSPN